MILEGASGNCAEEISEALRIPDITQTGARHIILELLNNLNVSKTKVKLYIFIIPVNTRRM